MWTPKRIILLAGGFLLFTLIYLVYSLTSLGRINTLPPLPEQYRPSKEGDSTPIVRTRQPFQTTPLERKLEQAFGKFCIELSWPVLLELNAKSMVMAAVECKPTEDGRVRLAPMSLALFGKKKNDGRDIEINTLKCKEAYLKFDRPVSSFSSNELNGRKLIEAELYGDTNTSIRITNNRRTTLKEDDLIVTITNGPLYYIEKSHLVRTSDHIHVLDGDKHIVDGRLVPPKAVIWAKGMEMELTTSSPPPRPGVLPSAKPKNESISGVKRIVLKEAVDMTLYSAGDGPFPANNKTPAKGADTSRAPTPSLIHIVTPGRFEYELFKDHDMARFDVPADFQQSSSPQDVTVERINPETGNDMLVCKHLDLRLKRRNDAPPSGAAAERRDTGPTEQGAEIETAHATGPDVTLTSDAEKLDAHGNDFFHDAGKKLTILKGTPYMEANKADSLIQAPKLCIQDMPLPAAASPAGASGDKTANLPPKTYQQIQASGPGRIHMLNKNTGKQTVHAYWNDELVSTREGTLDVLILRGAARFVDDEHDQWLKAEELKVWLLAEDKKPGTTAKAASPQPLPPEKREVKGERAAAKDPATPAQARRPHRLKAKRNVLAHSPDLNIHDAAQLDVQFIDVPPERMPPPSSSKDKSAAPPSSGNGKPAAPPSSSNGKPAAPPSSSNGKPAAPPPTNNGKPAAPPPTSKAAAAPSSVSAPAPRPPAAGPSGPPSAEDRKPVAEGRKPTAEEHKPQAEKQPIDLSARSIEAKVLRCEERMALDHLWAEGGALDNVDKRGGVIVSQQPSKPDEEGVYIEGNTLDMSCTADGNKLHVTGDLARLKLDKIFILGPEVSIDQVANKAWVDGEGAMRIQSNTNLEGKPLKRPVPLTIHWSQSMFFSGPFAEFLGSIEADQENARLACQVLQVMFDRPISLKDGMHGGQPVKVTKLAGAKETSSQDVRAEDQAFDEYGKLQKYQLLMGKEIQMETIPRDDDGSRQPGKSNDANKVVLSGPGSVRLMQRGDSDLTVTPGQPAANRPAQPAGQQQEMKLTYIRFEWQMQANNLTNVASFWGVVRLLNLPCDDPHCDIDLDFMLTKELPDKAMYLRCNVLKTGTYQRQIQTGTGQKQLRTYQEMDARGQVVVQGREFTAQCDHMTFNEEKDQVIFLGEGGNEAVLSKSRGKGEQPQIIRAEKIIYYRSTGRTDVSKLGSLDG